MSLKGFIDSLPAAIIGSMIGLGLVQAKERGRFRWVSLVGRPPRDLFADRRKNLFVNATYEWAWIGFTVWIASAVMFFIDATEGISEYVFWLGSAMILVRVIGVTYVVAFAKLNPKYEDQAAASPA